MARLDLSEVEKIIHAGICDPGRFTPRGDDYNEPVTVWGARAVMLALRDAGFVVKASDSGSTTPKEA